MIFCTPQRETALQVLRGPLIDQPGYPRGPYKGNGFDPGMIADRSDNLAVTVHDIEYTIRQPRLPQQQRQSPHAQRHLLRWLHDHAIAQRKRIGYRPVRHHRGEIEGYNGRYHSPGPALRPAFHPLADLQHLTGHQLGYGSSELRELDAFL